MVPLSVGGARGGRIYEGGTAEALPRRHRGSTVGALVLLYGGIARGAPSHWPLHSPEAGHSPKHADKKHNGMWWIHLVTAVAQECVGRWGALEEPPADPILGLKAVYAADEAQDKIDLTVGAYRTANGSAWVLPAVAAARRRVMGFHEYLPIDGLTAFRIATEDLLYGDSPAIKTTAQTLSGTGAVRLALEFMVRHGSKKLYLPRITWSNHFNIARDAGMAVDTYAYLEGGKLDFDGMINDLKSADEGAVVLLHLCAHNPTGVDPSFEQWETLAGVVEDRRLLPLFDSAYVGFATGDVERDSRPFRLFVDKGLAPWASVSFSKNFGLYSERVGALHATVSSEDEAKAVNGHLKKIARAMYSNPPAFGARVVAEVLTEPELKASWLDSLKVMSGRINDMRGLLRSKLEEKTNKDWAHVTDQIGMFSFTGLTKDQVHRLRGEHHVYMLDNGRVSMAGVNPDNVDRLATAIASVV